MALQKNVTSKNGNNNNNNNNNNGNDDYVSDLFDRKNMHLNEKVRSVKDAMLGMSFTKILLQLLHKDIKSLLAKETRLEFDFEGGLYLKGQRYKQVELMSFDGMEMAMAEGSMSQNIKKKRFDEKNEFLTLCALTVLRAIGKAYPKFFR